MSSSIDRVTAEFVAAHGWRIGSTLENQVSRILHGYGVRPERVRQQHRVGRYTLDFAWPDLKIALEADGWHHQSPRGAARDSERDAWLRSQGWLVLRVDDQHGEASLNDSLVRVCQVVRWHEGQG